MTYYFSILILVLCLVLFTFSSRVNRNSLYLLGFLIPLAIYGIHHHLVFFNASASRLAIVNTHAIPIYYLTGPMLFLYTRNTILDSTKLNKLDFLHFLPFLIGLTSILPYIFKSFDYKIDIAQQLIDDPNKIKTIHTHWFYPIYVNVIARPTLLISYSMASLVIIWKYTNIKGKESPVAQRGMIIKWLISLAILTFLIAILYLSMTYSFFNTQNIAKETFNQLPSSTFTGFAYAIVPITIFVFPGILYGIPRVVQISSSNQALGEETLQTDIENEYNSNDPLEETAKRILNYFEQNKPYLKSKFSIDSISEDLNIPRHHVGYCFTNIIKTKFTTLRTDYRVAYAKRLLLSSHVDILTMEGIGLESGFASKSSFFSVFKESTGLSPLDFMKQNKHQGAYRKYPKNNSEKFNEPEVN
jgi:AraC-like DNA-binding protein